MPLYPEDRIRALMVRGRRSAQVWRRRAAIAAGAVAIGLVALAFADVADRANAAFRMLSARWWWAPLIATPAMFAAIVAVTRRFAPAARGSGIPQVMVAKDDPDAAVSALVSVRTAIAKFVLTCAALLGGASVGREGPTVQIAAAIMAAVHRLFALPLRGSVMIAGGAAGVAAAFNTPIAGVAFAIEELAAAYEQRMTLLVMTAVLLAGMVSLGLAGDYVYFGVMRSTLPVTSALLSAPVAGVLGGLAGGLFSRLLIAAGRARRGPIAALRARPIRFAALCGAVVAVIGVTSGLTWGTSYEPARAIITGIDAPAWFGPAKFVATLATSISGLPGGVFAPSLATGAGLGSLLRPLFPDQPDGAIVLLGMIGYFTGVVRAPLTAVVIISEATASRGLMLPLLATALIAEGAAKMVCPEKLYHALEAGFRPTPSA